MQILPSHGGERHFFLGMRLRKILGRFSNIYFRGLGLMVMVWVRVMVMVWVRVMVIVRVSVLWSG